MSQEPYIPQKTAELLNGSVPEGGRHTACLKIAMSLLGNGLSSHAVFQTLRDKFPPDVTDTELEKVVRWAEQQHPSPSGNGNGASFAPQSFTRRPRSDPPKQKPPQEHCSWWLNGLELDAETLTSTSPVTIPESPLDSLRLFFESLYAPQHCLNIVTLFRLDEKKGKANPDGVGKSITCEKWIEWISTHKIPQSEAGAWLRMNPVDGLGVADENTTTFRYLLVESDVLPLPIQIALYSRLPLPVTAIFSSGGKSVHAWIRMDSPDIETYRTDATRILKALAPFGIDESNKNASRLSRLPGATRKIGASGDGLQRLLWLNPSAKALDQAGISNFEESLRFSVLENKPFKSVFKHALTRYEDLIENRGKNGVLTGLYSFDKDSGGLKKGQMTVISAETNGGKTSIAMNFVNAALSAGHGVALFTLEMDRDEICDMLMAMNCRVNRSHFNTGDFTDGEMKSIAARSSWFSALPLWIEDAPTMTASAIRTRTLQLVREKQIGLVVVDYIQFISPENPQEPREQQIACASRALRSLAKEAKLPIIVLSQLNDEGKLRESRVIGHDAHIVAAIKEINTRPMFNVVKGRSIPKNNHEFMFEAQFCLLKNPSRISDEDIPQTGRNPHAND